MSASSVWYFLTDKLMISKSDEKILSISKSKRYNYQTEESVEKIANPIKKS